MISDVCFTSNSNHMQKHVLKIFLLLLFFSACSTAHHQTAQSGNNSSVLPPASAVGPTDTAWINQPNLPAGTRATALTDLPRTEEGAFVLSPGLYEADFKTFCLQPGTPGPTNRDVYFQAPLAGPRKDLIEAILLGSRKNAYLPQKNVQLLLWSVVSNSDFHKLSPEVKSTAVQMLTPKQLFQLQGGVPGMVKTVARNLPASGGAGDIRKLFEVGATSYEAFERMAVLNTPSQIRRTDITQDMWRRHSDGYYVRYLPDNYQQTRIQVYVPDSMADVAAPDSGKYVVFDPASWMVVPANSNAQRLGIGGPLRDIVRVVIRNIPQRKNTPPPAPKPRNPKVLD